MSDEKILDHDADGIKEFNNPLPSWWIYLFLISVVFAFYYFAVYSFIGTTSGERAQVSMAELKATEEEVRLILARAKEKEKTVKGAATQQQKLTPEKEPVFSDDPDALAMGKKIYDSKCASCHGMQGEGLIGPNFADKYWIHGKGEFKDLYKVIRDGVPEKGMISWKRLLSTEEMAASVVYIKQFEGTNPPNQKAAQGTLIE